MRKEIDIVVKAVGKSCVVVEKASHVSWTLEELVEAQMDERFQREDLSCRTGTIIKQAQNTWVCAPDCKIVG